jgi:hypothetical protein
VAPAFQGARVLLPLERPVDPSVSRVLGDRCLAAHSAFRSADTPGCRAGDGDRQVVQDDRGLDSSRRMLARTSSELDNKGRTDMASSGKKKTTMAKLTRESRLRERRLDKQARKDARKLAAAQDPDHPGDTLDETTPESTEPSTEPGSPQPSLETVGHALADA